MDEFYEAFQPFVDAGMIDEEYIEMLGDEGREYAMEYYSSSTPKVALAAGYYEESGIGLEYVAEEFGVSRRSLFNARKRLEESRE